MTIAGDQQSHRDHGRRPHRTADPADRGAIVANDIRARVVPVNFASHSRTVEPLRSGILDLLAFLRPSRARCRCTRPSPARC